MKLLNISLKLICSAILISMICIFIMMIQEHVYYNKLDMKGTTLVMQNDKGEESPFSKYIRPFNQN